MIAMLKVCYTQGATPPMPPNDSSRRLRGMAGRHDWFSIDILASLGEINPSGIALVSSFSCIGKFSKGLQPG